MLSLLVRKVSSLQATYVHKEYLWYNMELKEQANFLEMEEKHMTEKWGSGEENTFWTKFEASWPAGIKF